MDFLYVCVSNVDIHSLCCCCCLPMIYLLSIQLQHFMNEKASITIKWALYFFFRGWKKTAVSQNSTIWKKQQLFWFPKSFLEKWIDKDWLSSIFCQIIFMFDLSLGNLSFRYPNPTLLTTLETIFIEPFLFFPDHDVRIY